MVIVVLNSPRSAKTSLEYNATKVRLGLADVIGLHGIEGYGDDYTIEKTITSRENNPNISARARTLGFHATISPGPNEDMTDETALQYATEYMEDIGYAAQPWVLYKHMDIDRIHYHIVSSKVKKDGTVLWNSFIGKKTEQFIKRTGPKYGMTLGKAPGTPGENIKYMKRFNAAKGNVTSQIKHFFKVSLKYSYGSVEDFVDIMESYGIRTNIRMSGSSDKKNTLGFVGLDRNGNTISNHMKDEDIDATMFRQIIDGIGEVKKSPGDIADSATVIESCMEVADSEKKFLAELKKAGIDCFLDKDQTGYITDAKFIDHAHRTVLGMQDLKEEFTLEMLNQVARDWKENWGTVIAAPLEEYKTSETLDFLDKVIAQAKSLWA